jgi:ABC-2 type transport system ATP-binding protein
LDEPLSGLDATSAFIFRKLVAGFAAEGKAIFYCSHVLEVVETTCTHLLILRKGTVVAYGETRAVLEQLNQSSLVNTFSSLTPEIDAGSVAASIVEVVCTT